MSRKQLKKNPQHQPHYSIPGYRDLGWANAWSKLPDEVAECRAAGHLTIEVDNAMYRYRGTDWITICHACKMLYHVDSSD